MKQRIVLLVLIFILTCFNLTINAEAILNSEKIIVPLCFIRESLNCKHQFTQAELEKIEEFINIFSTGTSLVTDRNGNFSKENIRDFLVEYYLYRTCSPNVEYTNLFYIGKKEDIEQLAYLYFDMEIEHGFKDKECYEYKDGKYYRPDGDYGDISFFKLDKIKSIGNNKYIVQGRQVIEDVDMFGKEKLDAIETVEATIEKKDGRYVLRKFKMTDVNKN
ncbi:hypothetical protein [Inediibacterium massiliense]|uniref:hypothetical protein n=1 Tax=Inediibacterium massiliense TaxID=1658111 RepID=UPI0006B43B4C|nr:hypothetical protein [Inediibacterium massiliense]